MWLLGMALCEDVTTALGPPFEEKQTFCYLITI